MNLPTSWRELSDKELIKVFRVLRFKDKSEHELLTLILVSLLGINIIEKRPEGWIVKPIGFFKPRCLIRTYEFRYMIKKLEFLFEEPEYPVCLSRIGRHDAVDASMRGVDFQTYLTCDNFYQAYLQSHDSDFLRRMAVFLYDHPKIRLNSETEYAVFYWWTTLKGYFNKRYPYLFVQKEGGASPIDMEDSMNSIIRALTGGDPTREPAVFSLDATRALNELNQKAREIFELNKHKKS